MSENLRHYQMYINGEFCRGRIGRKTKASAPGMGDSCRFPEGNSADVKRPSPRQTRLRIQRLGECEEIRSIEGISYEKFRKRCAIKWIISPELAEPGRRENHHRDQSGGCALRRGLF